MNCYDLNMDDVIGKLRVDCIQFSRLVTGLFFFLSSFWKAFITHGNECSISVEMLLLTLILDHGLFGDFGYRRDWGLACSIVLLRSSA